MQRLTICSLVLVLAATIATAGALTVTADVLYSYENGPWRVLGEYFLTNEENELERLQFGYDYSADSTICRPL